MAKFPVRVSPVRAALAATALAALPMASQAFVSVGVSITVAPPALPVYVQPPCPAVGYIWTPGYWGWDDGDYYWVPGTWVMAPSPGLLWTPGYWGWGEGVYAWHAGYWGPHVGFYGGVNYGYGYGGVGFEGGYWRGGAFYYNRSVANLGSVHVTNVYNKTVINNINVTRVSYNGGQGGLGARPNGAELAAARDRHVDFTPAQRTQEHAAFSNRDLRASVNNGRPRIAATERPGVFTGRGVVEAREGGGYHPPEHGAGSAAPRNDRPGSAGTAAVGGRGSPGAPGGGFNHNDRPPGASGNSLHAGDRGPGSNVPRTGTPGSANQTMRENRGEPAMRENRPEPAARSGGGSPQPAQSRVNPGNQPHNAPSHMSSPPQGREFNGGGASRAPSGPRPEAAPRVQAQPRPQQQAAPQQREAPHADNRRGGGEPRQR